jgi:HK97 family phage prohead protease
MPDMQFKFSAAEFKTAGDKGEYQGYFSVFENLDDGGDVIHRGAFAKTLAERGSRVKVFYAHDWTKLLGPTPTLIEDDHGLLAKGRLTLDSFWGKEVWALMKDGALTEGSIGYESIPDKTQFVEGMRHLYELKLYEVSPVPLGMNAMTDIRAVKTAMFRQMKAAIPPKETPKADEATAWNASEVLANVEGAEQLRRIHAWVDPEGDPDAKGSYKLPHHLADGNVVWKGVAAAGAALMGSRGGVDIPESDVAGVQRHLALHYGQFDKTPPWDKSANADTYIEALQAITRELKEGRTLSAASKEKIEGAISAMQAALEALGGLLEAATPPKTIDLSALELRFRMAEQMLAMRAR